MGATGVWYGIAFSNVAIFLVAGAWFLRGTWTDAVIDGAPSPEMGPGAPADDGPVPASEDVPAEDD